LIEKCGFGLSKKKEVLEMISRYVKENKIPAPFRGGIPGDYFLSTSKERIS